MAHPVGDAPVPAPLHLKRDSGQAAGAGGPEYLEVVGSRRLSTEFGDLLETQAPFE